MTEYTDYIRELFEPLGAVEVRKMFGGYGVFFDGLMIALIADETLYLKTDKQSAPRFQELGLTQFEFPRGDKMIKMSYFLAPESALDDPQQMREWAQLAYEAALRSSRKSAGAAVGRSKG